MSWVFGIFLFCIIVLLFKILVVLDKLNTNLCKTARALTDGNAKIHEELIGIRYDQNPNQQEVSRGRFL